MVKNPPDSAGDVGLIPDPGRFHKPWSNLARAPRLVKPVCSRAHAQQQEKPLPRGSLRTASREQPPVTTTREKLVQQ